MTKENKTYQKYTEIMQPKKTKGQTLGPTGLCELF